MKKFKTNEELVMDLMQHSPQGALCQAFIIEAIRYYSEQVSKSIPKEDSNSFISPVAWHNIAVDILQRLEENYSQRISG